MSYQQWYDYTYNSVPIGEGILFMIVLSIIYTIRTKKAFNQDSGNYAL